MRVWQALTGCGVVAAVTWTASRAGLGQFEPTGHPAVTLPSPHPGDPSEAALEDLREQFAALRAKQEALSGEVSAFDPDVDGQPSQSDSDGGPAAPPPRPGLATIVEEQQVALERLLGQEDDPEWAAWAESEIAMRAETVLSGATAVHTECGAAVCRSEISFDDPEGAVRALDRLAGLISWSSDCFSVVDESDPTSAVLYATREGTAMPGFGAAGM